MRVTFFMKTGIVRMLSNVAYMVESIRRISQIVQFVNLESRKVEKLRELGCESDVS